MNREQGSDRTSLTGKTIVVTRREEQAEEFSRALQARGATTILFPAVEISEPESWNSCDSALERLTEYSGIIFTSRNAVRYFFDRIRTHGKQEDVRNIPLYPVGSKTKSAIEQSGFVAQDFPEEYSAEHLAHFLVKKSVVGKKFLFPKGNLARKELVTILIQHGTIVDDVVVYETKEPEMSSERRDLIQTIVTTADVITFFSPSSVEFFLRAVPLEKTAHKVIAAFGETTANAVRQAGLPNTIVSSNSRIQTFVDSIQHYFIEHESDYAITQ